MKGIEVGDDAGYTDQIMKGLICASKVFTFYPIGSEKPLENLEQGTNTRRFVG